MPDVDLPGLAAIMRAIAGDLDDVARVTGPTLGYPPSSLTGRLAQLLGATVEVVPDRGPPLPFDDLDP